jgi:hypothetical protein
VATQHSLPSGRYSLLGPDFHRPDRTSLRLAHLFDHLLGARDHLRGERYYIWDSELAGFGLRVEASGTKIFKNS